MELREAMAGGIGLGLLVCLWQVGSAAVLGPTPLFVPVAVSIETIVLLVLLGRARGQRSFVAHAATGSGAAAIATLPVFAGSLLVSTVLFPDLLASLPNAPSPLSAAAAGGVGTFATGVVVSTLAGWFLRRR